MRISIPILLIVGVLLLSFPGVGEGRGVTVEGTASKHVVGLSLGGCGK